MERIAIFEERRNFDGVKSVNYSPFKSIEGAVKHMLFVAKFQKLRLREDPVYKDLLGQIETNGVAFVMGFDKTDGLVTLSVRNREIL